jgi:uncharacterized membrane protein
MIKTVAAAAAHRSNGGNTSQGGGMTVGIKALKHGEQWCRRPPMRSLARQRGAIGIFGAVTLLLSVLFTALAVDTGRLMLEQRRLQKIADMAALDGARALSCGGDKAAVDAAVNQSTMLNNHTGDVPDVELGKVQPQDGVRVFGPPEDKNLLDAVRVTVGDTKVPASLVAGGWFGNTVNLQAKAVAGAPMIAALSVGSYLARLNTDNSMLAPVLNGLLGISAAAGIVSYEGLADAKVTLLDLINAQAEVGTVDQLLDSEITMKEFVLLAAEALSNQLEPPTVAIDLLETIAVQVDADLHLRLEDLLQVDLPAGQSALEAQLNVLDLIGLGAEVANSKHALQAALPINIPGVATAILKTYIIEPPKIAIGPAGRGADGEWITRAHTAQVNTQLSLSLLNGLNLGSQGTGLVNLDLVITGADARAGFESFGCNGSDRTAEVGHVVSALRVGVGRIKEGEWSKVNPQIVPSPVVNLPGVLVIKASANLELGQRVETLTFDPLSSKLETNNNELGTAVSTLLDGLASDLTLEITDDTLLGSILSSLLNPLLDWLGGGSSQGLLDSLANLLTPVLQALDPFLDELLSALGLDVAGADINVMDVKDGQGGRPKLLI